MDTLVDPQALEAFCRKWKIAELQLFGSHARGDAGPGSDVDLLYRFEPDAEWGLEFVDMVEEMKALTGRKVDFVSLDAVQHSRLRRSRDAIIADARRIYPHAA